jgi:hypothetical protein
LLNAFAVLDGHIRKIFTNVEANQQGCYQVLILKDGV